MTAPRLAGVAVLAVLAALLLSWWLAPDTGPPVVPPTTVAKVPGPAPRAAPAATARTSTGMIPTAPRPPGSGVAPLPEQHAMPFVPPTGKTGEAHSADQQGIGIAALERREDLLRCWGAYLQAGGSAGRFTIRVTVSDDGAGQGVAVADVPQIPDDRELQDCVRQTFADAIFDSPGDHPQSVVWAVPMGTSGD
jgi:hypothetical protein